MTRKLTTTALIISFFFSVSGVRAADLDHQAHVDIIFSETELFNDAELRKIVYIAAELAKTAEGFKKNPSAYPIWEEVPKSQATHLYDDVDYKPVIQSDSKKVLEKRRDELLKQVDGTNVTQSLAFSALSAAAPLVGGGKLSGSLKLGAKSYDLYNQGKSPEYSDTATVGIGEYLEKLKTLDPNAYAMVLDETKKRMDFNLDQDLSNHRTVQAFEEKVANEEATELLQKSVEQLAEDVKKLNSLSPEQIEAQKVKALRDEVESGFGAAAMLASLTGYPEVGQKVSIAGKIADKVLVLSSGGSGAESATKLGMMAATQNYVAIASLAVELFSDGGGGFEASVMQQMQQIMEMIADLSMQIDREFFLVNEKLDNLDKKLSQIIAEIRNSSKVSQALIKDAINAVAELESVVNATQLAVQANIVSAAKRSCIEDTQGFDTYTDAVVVLFKNTCLTPLLKASSDAISMDRLSMRTRNLEEFSDYALSPNAKHVVPTILDLLGDPNIGAHPGISTIQPSELVHPESWLTNTSSFLDLVEAHPRYHYLFLPKDFEDVRDAGKNYVLGQQGLLAKDSSNLRFSVISKLLENYTETVLKGLRAAIGGKFDLSETDGTPKLGIVNRYHFNRAQDFNQLNDQASWHPNGRELGWCGIRPAYRAKMVKVENRVRPVFPGVPVDGPVLTRTLSASEKDLFFSNNNPLRYGQGVEQWNSHHTRMRFLRLPNGFENYLPNNIRWFLQMERSNISACLAYIEFDEFTVFESRPASQAGLNQVQAENGARYHGKAHVHIYYGKKLFSDGAFPVKGEFEDQNRQFAYMHSVGVDLPSRDYVGKMFSNPKASIGVFSKGLQDLDGFEALFKDKYEASWDEEAIEYFSGGDLKFLTASKKASAIAELLFHSVDVGLNPHNPNFEKVVNYIFSESGLPSPTQLLTMVIEENTTVDEVAVLLEKRTKRLLTLFRYFQNYAVKFDQPVFSHPQGFVDQLDRLEFLKKEVYFPVQPSL